MNYRVLVIENNNEDAERARSLLAGQFETVIVRTLSEGIERLHTQYFDAALLDLTLPDSQGIDGLRRIRETASRLPVVILTSVDDEQTATAAVQAGAQDYLLKADVTRNSLARSLRHGIERQELTDRLADSIDELERQRASVVRLNQSKNDLIAVLAHDIKGPLTSIVGFAELLEEGFLEGESATDAAKTIRSNAQRLATLANDVLALSRVEHGELEIADERVDLGEVLNAVMELHAPERTVDFERTVDSAMVRGDGDRLRQVFDNLIRNAIKYSPSGERVDVRLSAEDNTYRVDVTDRGIGIPEDELSRLFARFWRASNARRAKISGTGIGLFIVNTIVERHGGKVQVQSTLGEGSTFSVALPKLEATTSERPMRVTVLSADKELSRFAAYELRARGYRVQEASTLDDLICAGTIRSHDVILVDCGTSGAQEVRDAFTDRRVSLVGIGSADGRWDAVLPKPFLVTDLVAAVSALDASFLTTLPS